MMFAPPSSHWHTVSSPLSTLSSLSRSGEVDLKCVGLYNKCPSSCLSVEDTLTLTMYCSRAMNLQVACYPNIRDFSDVQCTFDEDWDLEKDSVCDNFSIQVVESRIANYHDATWIKASGFKFGIYNTLDVSNPNWIFIELETNNKSGIMHRSWSTLWGSITFSTMSHFGL